MDNGSDARSQSDKSRLRLYRVGEFLIARVGSRWRICAGRCAPNGDFSTLGGAIAWCRQIGDARVPDKVHSHETSQAV
jgi:hypothetical protein